MQFWEGVGLGTGEETSNGTLLIKLIIRKAKVWQNLKGKTRWRYWSNG